MPGQSIKNVSRAEIIKVRISSAHVSVERVEERGCTMRGPERAVIERKREEERVWKKGLGGCLKYSPV